MVDTGEFKETTGSASDPNFELNTMLDEMQRAGMCITRQWQTMWLTAIKYAWGEQLANIRPNEDWNYIVVNRIYPLMFQNIAKLSKRNPKVLAFAWDDSKKGVAEFVEQWAGVLEYIWKSPYELAMRSKLIKGLLDAALFGYMIGKTYWDDRVTFDRITKKDVGNVQQTFIHPATFWVDPSADNMETAENCGTHRRVTMEWAQNKWPEHKDDIEGEAFTSSDPKYVEGDVITYQHQRGATLHTDEWDRYNRGTVGGARLRSFSQLVNLILKKFHRGDQDYTAHGTSQKYVDVEEIYWKDNEKRHVKIEDNVASELLVAEGKITLEPVSGLFLDPATGKEVEAKDWPKETIKEYDERLFQDGRFVIRIGKVILNPKKEDQKYPYSHWPFNVMPYHILPHMWQGGNAIEMARNNNDMLNMTVSALVRRVQLTADPERLIEAGALGRDRKGKFRRTNPFGLGKYIKMAKGKIDKIKNMEYAPLDPATLTLAGILKQDIDDAMFMQDTARGASSTKGGMGSGGGRITATEAARLDVNSHDYTALQSIFLDLWLDNTFTLLAEIIQLKYEAGRIMKIRGDDGNKKSVMTSKEFLDVRFDVNVEPGSTLPFDEEKKKADYAAAYKMLENPMPNPLTEEMLRILEIANREKVLARHQGLSLFRQFVQLSQMLAQAQPEQVQQVLTQIPILKPLYDLMMQTAQLAPAMGIEAPKPEPQQNQTQKAG